MVQHTDTHMGTHTHIWAKQEFWPIRVYGLPVRVWAAHTHTGSTRMGCPYAYGTAHTRMGRIPVWDGTTILDTSYGVKLLCILK